MPHNFSWIFEGRLAAMGRPGCALELVGEMLPHERRFLAWLNTAGDLTSDRLKVASRMGLSTSDTEAAVRRVLATYRKFRDIWGILKAYREGFGPDGQPVDRFVRSPERTKADLAYVKAGGVDTLLTLTERPVCGALLETYGLDSLHVPIPDGEAPSRDQVHRCLAFLDDQIGSGRCVMIHCLGGYGRTGTVAASYLVHCDMPASDAIEGIRQRRPGSIENQVQESAVYELGEHGR